MLLAVALFAERHQITEPVVAPLRYGRVVVSVARAPESKEVTTVLAGVTISFPSRGGSRVPVGRVCKPVIVELPPDVQKNRPSVCKLPKLLRDRKLPRCQLLWINLTTKEGSPQSRDEGRVPGDLPANPTELLLVCRNLTGDPIDIGQQCGVTGEMVDLPIAQGLTSRTGLATEPADVRHNSGFWLSIHGRSSHDISADLDPGEPILPCPNGASRAVPRHPDTDPRM